MADDFTDYIFTGKEAGEGVVRKYRLNQLDHADMADEIMRKMYEIDGLQNISISEDLQCLCIEADKNMFSQVMDKAVNVCKKVSQSCEVMYMF